MSSEAGTQVPNADVIESNIKNAEAEIAKVKAEIAEVKTKIETAEADIAEVKTKIETAVTALNNSEDNEHFREHETYAYLFHENAAERRKALQKKEDTLRTEKDTLQEKEVTLQKKEATLQATLQADKAALNRLNSIVLGNAPIVNAVDGSESNDLDSGLRYIRNAEHRLSYGENSHLDPYSSGLQLSQINDFDDTWKAIAFSKDDFDEDGAIKADMRTRVQQALENARGNSFDEGYYKASLDLLLLGCPMRRLTGMGEMFLQQFIYPLFSALLVAACFDARTDYKADEIVRSSLLCKYREAIDDNYSWKSGNFEIKPDAASTLFEQFDPFAMMELKRSTATSSAVQIDQEKCIALLCSTLISLKRQEMASAKLRLPFIIGHGHVAFLFVVEFGDESKEAIPKVSIVGDKFDLGTNKQRTELFVALFLLLRDVKKILSGDKEMENKMINYKNSCRRNAQKLTNVPNAIPSKSRTRSAKRQKTSGGNQKKEELARQAAQCGGLFHGIDIPWPQRISLDEDFTPDYQEQSPYYFIGRSKSNGKKCFLKIWREGDNGFHDARDEVRFLKLAQNHNVAVARLITDDVVPVSVHGIQFEVLATEYVDSSLISSVDHLLHFSVSLMKVVRTLHDEVGVLHCDIKPNNLRWLSSHQQVYLIDFGHAQLVEGAQHYNATKDFEAPEIRNGKLPHSRETDTYSVGATILWVWDDYTRRMGLMEGGMDGTMKKLRFVGESLSAPVKDRISLDHAICVLETLEEDKNGIEKRHLLDKSNTYPTGYAFYARDFLKDGGCCQ